MLQNYLRLALRHLQNHKGQTFINVFGLAVGVCAALLIYRMVTYELSFNKNFKNYDRIVRAVTTETGNDGVENYTRGVPGSAMVAMQNTVSQFSVTSRIQEAWPTVLVPNPTGGPALKKFNTAAGQISFFVEPGFFQIFDFQWLVGDPATALKEPNTVVLTRSMAEKCFGNSTAALGQTLLLYNDPMIVRGIVEDGALNSDLPINLVISYATLPANKAKYQYQEIWDGISSNDQFFALLHDENQRATADLTMATIGKKEYRNVKKNHHLQPLSEIHFDDRYGTSATTVVSKSKLWVLSSIGLLVLLMACFNFINLSTAQALRRSKEVGVRKTLGGSRGILFRQFMGETALVVVFSVGLGAVLASIAAPLLKLISDVPDALPFLSNPLAWAFLAALTVLITLLSGAYPALVMAGFNPVRALKNDISTRAGGGVSVRKGLVVLQFAIAQVLVIGTIITLGQLQYLRNMDLGFKKDLVYNFNIDGDSTSQAKMDGMKQRLLQIPGVQAVSLQGDKPASGNTWSSNFAFGRGSQDATFNTALKYCDADFQKVYDLRMLAGRWLQPSDTTREYVINETLLKKAGVNNPEEAIGKELRIGSSPWRTIVGVVKDFHSHSAHNELEPLIMMSSRKRFYGAGVKILPQNITATTAAVQRIFDDTYPEQFFDASFFDASIAEFYTAEDRFSSTCKGFALLAILISCLGLFGLAAHAAQQRTKEIGVRKVLGASVAGIIGLLSRDFLKLVVIAIVIATPLAWYFMHQWLAGFVYRIDMQWWMFVLAGLLAIAVALLTVGYQSLRAALADPVKSLRSE